MLIDFETSQIAITAGHQTEWVQRLWQTEDGRTRFEIGALHIGVVSDVRCQTASLGDQISPLVGSHCACSSSTKGSNFHSAPQDRVQIPRASCWVQSTVLVHAAQTKAQSNGCNEKTVRGGLEDGRHTFHARWSAKLTDRAMHSSASSTQQAAQMLFLVFSGLKSAKVTL